MSTTQTELSLPAASFAKQNEKIWFFVNLTMLNSHTNRDAYPLPACIGTLVIWEKPRYFKVSTQIAATRKSRWHSLTNHGRDYSIVPNFNSLSEYLLGPRTLLVLFIVSWKSYFIPSNGSYQSSISTMFSSFCANRTTHLAHKLALQIA